MMHQEQIVGNSKDTQIKSFWKGKSYQLSLLVSNVYNNVKERLLISMIKWVVSEDTEMTWNHLNGDQCPNPTLKPRTF